MANLDSILKSRDITLPTKVLIVKPMVFPVVMYRCESWTIKKAKGLMFLNCGVGEDSWVSLGLQGDQTSPSKGNQSWIFIGKADAEAEASIFWPPNVKNKMGKTRDLSRKIRDTNRIFHASSVQFSSVAQSCPTLCDPSMDCSMLGFPSLHSLREFAQAYVHWVSDAIQPSHSLLSPSPPAPNLSQHQGLLQWVSSSHQVAKVLKFQLQHQSF